MLISLCLFVFITLSGCFCLSLMMLLLHHSSVDALTLICVINWEDLLSRSLPSPPVIIHASPPAPLLPPCYLTSSLPPSLPAAPPFTPTPLLPYSMGKKDINFLILFQSMYFRFFKKNISFLWNTEEIFLQILTIIFGRRKFTIVFVSQSSKFQKFILFNLFWILNIITRF